MRRDDGRWRAGFSSAALALAALLAGCTGSGMFRAPATAPAGVTPASVPAGVPAIDSNVARQGYFYAGGKYVGEPASLKSKNNLLASQQARKVATSHSRGFPGSNIQRLN